MFDGKKHGRSLTEILRLKRIWLAVALYAILLIAIATSRAPLWLGGAYVILSALSAILYYRDKRAAIAGTWRTSENALHLVDLGGGIVGGLLAQHIFRHKTFKPGFRITTWVILGLHFVFLIGLTAGCFFLPQWQALAQFYSGSA
jgi:uncharacterized membrane protein YsdA (DUF1294 family)